MSVSEVCTRYGVSRSWIYELLHRYQKYGIDGLKPGVKAPIKHGMALAPAVRAAIIRLRTDLNNEGLDNGAKTIAYHLEQEETQGLHAALCWRKKCF
jgi:hypothetical protein